MNKILKAIVIGLGSAGDVHPNVGLALALQRRGHQVLFVGPAFFQPLAKRVGLEFAGIGSAEEYNEAIHDPDLWHPFRAFRVVAKRLLIPSLRPVYELIAGSQESGRTVVAAPATALGARIAHEKLGVPLATVHLQPALIRSAIDPPCYGFPDILAHLPRPLRSLYYRAVDRFFIDPLIAAETNAFRRELGLPPVRRLFDQWIHSPQLVIGLFPEWFAPAPPDWPPTVRLTGFPLWDEGEVREPSPELEVFLAAGDPPIVFTLGSAMTQGKEFFRVSAEICRKGRRRGLLLTHFPEQLPGQLPDGVCQFDYIPFSTVLPRTAAFVHHGGIGTTAQALAAGVPQLVVPLAHDQPDNAVRVRRLGTGDLLPPKDYKVGAALARLELLLGSPTVKENCRRWAQEPAGQKGIEQTCRLLEELPSKR